MIGYIPIFLLDRKWGVIIDKKFDKEYSTSYTLEYLFLKENNIPYTFVKTENGITVWKYKKNYKLFDTLKNFYKNQ